MLPTWKMYLDLVLVFHGFSFLALFVMSIERYLGAYYPIFHRTSVTRRRLLTLLAILFFLKITLYVLSINDMVINWAVEVIVFIILVFPILVYVNFKQFKISREMRRRIATSPERRTTVNLKSISTSLFVVVCLVVLSIPASVAVSLYLNNENQQATNTRLSYIWATTLYTMNCTLNSLIFFWRHKVLRAEGKKILRTLKGCIVGS